MTATAKSAIAAYQRIAEIAQANAPALNKAAQTMQTNAWVGGGASGFSKELFAHRTRVQQAFQSALDELAELIVREGGTSPPRLHVTTPMPTAMSAGAGGFRGIDEGQMEVLVKELDRAGDTLLAAGSQLQSACSALCVAPGAGRTIGAAGAWAEAQTTELRRRLDVIKRRVPTTENGLPLTGPFPGAGMIGAATAAYELFGASDTAPSKARDLLARAGKGDAEALKGLLNIQRGGKDASLAGRIKAWWETLDPATAKKLGGAAPGLVGSLNGLPSATRDKLNRTFLATEEKRLTKQLSKLDQDARSGRFPALTDPRVVSAAATQIGDKLRRVQAVKTALAKGGRDGVPPALLLSFDAVHGHGRAVVSYGDPDKANNITTYVPGFTTTVEGDGTDFDRSLTTWKVAAELDPGKRTASIAWLGYDAPQLEGVAFPGHSVAFDGAADKGAQELASFVDGLHATHDLTVPARLTMVGHSYGSLTTGKAARLRPGTFADDLVFVGSPGVSTSHADQLSMGRDHVWVGASDNDPVAKIGRFGGDPDSPEFGAIRFRAGEGGHSDYWADDSDSLRNISRVIAGKFDEVQKMFVPFL